MHRKWSAVNAPTRIGDYEQEAVTEVNITIGGGVMHLPRYRDAFRTQWTRTRHSRCVCLRRTSLKLRDGRVARMCLQDE